MSSTLFPTAKGLTGLIVASMAIAPICQAQSQAAIPPGSAAVPWHQQLLDADSSPPVAQTSASYAPVGCRITRARVGVYQEPNVTEAALGLLAKEVTVTLGSGSGNGWARIVSPETGWVQAKFLRGNGKTPCPLDQQPPATTVLAPDAASDGAISETATVVSRAVCEVLPESGLIVRDQPSLLQSRVIGSIQPGNYTFQFKGRRTDGGESQRQWAYITAPAKGWVSTGIVDGGRNLAGEGCA